MNSRFFRGRFLSALSVSAAVLGLALAPPVRAAAVPPHGRPLPPFVGISTWLDSPPLTTNDLRGKVVLVEFWTFDCINCKHTLPTLVKWDAKYRRDGLAIVGVHTPELPYERDVANVKASIARWGIRYPVAVDPNYATWRAYGNDSWPHIYLADRTGRIRYDVVGEGGYDETEAQIKALLRER